MNLQVAYDLRAAEREASASGSSARWRRERRVTCASRRGRFECRRGTTRDVQTKTWGDVSALEIVAILPLAMICLVTQYLVKGVA